VLTTSRGEHKLLVLYELLDFVSDVIETTTPDQRSISSGCEQICFEMERCDQNSKESGGVRKKRKEKVY
jgi:hypothetical protein